jgi:hypothetical protein
VTGTAQDITGPKLCGYDPVPYADDRAKALIVVYNCLALNDDIWRSQGEITWREINWKKKPPISAKGESDDPDYREDTAARFGASASGPFGAVLRNSAVGEIRCFRDLGQ